MAHDWLSFWPSRIGWRGAGQPPEHSRVVDVKLLRERHYNPQNCDLQSGWPEDAAKRAAPGHLSKLLGVRQRAAVEHGARKLICGRHEASKLLERLMRSAEQPANTECNQSSRIGLFLNELI